MALKLRTHNLNVDYNNTYEDEYEKRAAILGEILGEMGGGNPHQGPIAFHYGKHTKIGRNFFGNFNLTIQDDGEGHQLGTGATLAPMSPLSRPSIPWSPEERNALLGPDGKPKRLCYAKPVHIGSDVWLGANVVVCPGVTIGDGCVIGAGAVVTRDIPPRTFVSPQATPAGSSGKSPNRTAWPTSRRFWRISPCPKASRACTDTQKRLPRRGPFYVRSF